MLDGQSCYFFEFLHVLFQYQEATAGERKVTEWIMQPCFGPEDAGWELGVIPWAKQSKK